ncbi:MAG: phosphoribosylamine--glycine ligase [Gammaproteobacteria bacterium]|nr:phosphoribosylamine--glycine ligase [Gammaproteobacteria bacterium]
MDVLIVGGGGREHAMAWKIARGAQAGTVYVAPGNAGTALEDGVANVAIADDDIEQLCAFAHERGVGLTVVGPEAPLAQGIVDRFRERGLAIFGPTRAAAQLESSKVFCKDFMQRHGIPTAAWRSFSDARAAQAFLRECPLPVVVKADGLAAGKGVVVARERAEAERAAREMLSGDRFGDAGRRIVIEDFLEGEEASFICLCDGRSLAPLAASQDHKARDDGDAGPNTGGMGAYSPAPVVTGEVRERVMREIMRPVVAGLAADGIEFTGFLYAGLMVDKQGGARVLEFNCRLGDPETQPLLMRLRTDLLELCLAAVHRRLDGAVVEWDERTALGVVLASGGYPGACDTGHVIEGLDSVSEGDAKVFHAGARLDGGVVRTSGGRVLCVTSLGGDVAEARERAYRACERIRWPRRFFRTDIGHRAV